VPSLSADNPEYQRDGGYWRGGVWAPTNYMVLKGLEKNGYNDLAYSIARNCFENVISVFRNDGTIYENYAPESENKGQPAKNNFVGWSGLFPISILFEYVFGIRAVTKENKIVWDIRILEKHGVQKYPFKNLSVDLVCQERSSEDEEPIVTAISQEPIEIEIRYKNKIKIIHASVEKRN
jgi:glycogen debranching enzyme